MSVIDYNQKVFSVSEKARLLKEAQHIRQKYTDRLPIIVQSRDSGIDLKKHKYLVPSDITMSQFMYVIRKRIQLNADKALFIFVNDTIPPSSSMMSLIFNEHVDSDIGMLVLVISKENTFGIK